MSESILHGNQSLLHPRNTNSSNQHSHPGHSHLSQGATDTESQCEPVSRDQCTVGRREHTGTETSHLIPGRHIDIRDYMTNPHRWCGDVISFLTQSSSQIGHTHHPRNYNPKKSRFGGHLTPPRRLAANRSRSSREIQCWPGMLACHSGHRVSEDKSGWWPVQVSQFN